MSLEFDAPANALCLLSLVPLAVVCRAVRGRQLRAARALGLLPQSRLAAGGTAIALGGAVTLLALAASKPVAWVERAAHVRTDAEAYLVVDTSVSMLARRRIDSEPRITKARSLVGRLALMLPQDVPIGLATMPRAVLPLLAPTIDRTLLVDVAQKQLVVGAVPGRPGWTRTTSSTGQAIRQVSTTFDSLRSLVDVPFFAADRARRLVILITDGESAPFDATAVERLLTDEGVRVLVVRTGSSSDRIWRAVRGRLVRDRSYVPQLYGLDQLPALENVATALGGTGVLRPDDAGEIARRARALLGDGPRVRSGGARDSIALGPYTALAAVPLVAFALAPLVPLPTIPMRFRRRRG